MKYQKPQPVFIISIVFLIAAAAIGYYLFMPNYKKFNEQRGEIDKISKTIELESDYESKMKTIEQKLEEINWESKKQKIQVNFDSSPFFLPKIEVFFKDLVAKSGMTLGGISFGTPTPMKVSSQQQTQTETEGLTKETKEQAESTPVVQTQSSGAIAGIKGPVKSISFTLSVNGTYQKFKNLLNIFEKQAFLISVKSVSFSSMAEDGTSFFSITGEIYSY